jgi:hypothetical protein
LPTSNISSPESQQSPQSPKPSSQNNLVWILNLFIVLLVLVIGFFSYGYLTRKSEPPPSPVVQKQPEQTPQKPSRVIQLDVLNGCGAKGIGIKFTNYLRASGFDVVEMKNYKSFHVPQTMVVDRIGNLQTAKQVAKALGVSEKNVIQQLNPDYYVEVSVIIGKDYADLKISQ